jgi:predicted nucleic acid-binding protein
MIHLDTSVLIEVFDGKKALAPRLRQLLNAGERMSLSSMVLFEWRRGPRISEQIEAQEALFPSADAITFGPDEAMLAADIYKKIKRPRGREIDIAVAACAIVHDAQLWTVNNADFKDIPGLRVLQFSDAPTSAD